MYTLQKDGNKYLVIKPREIVGEVTFKEYYTGDEFKEKLKKITNDHNLNDDEVEFRQEDGELLYRIVNNRYIELYKMAININE